MAEDQIVRFVEHARRQEANVTFDAWPTMNHDFQVYGDELPQSKEAWQRIAEFIVQCVSSTSPAEEPCAIV